MPSNLEIHFSPWRTFSSIMPWHSTEVARWCRILRSKIARIHSPVLIVQGSVDRRETPINRFNAEVLIPELRAANKAIEVRTYEGQGHCFCIGSGVPRPSGRPTQASAPAAALAAFRDIDAFCRKYLRTQPKDIDAILVTQVPARSEW